MTAISNFEDMHEDICATAADKRAALIMLPFHKSQRLDGQFETTAPGFRIVNQKVLQHAPCSVAILIDRGVGGSAQVAPCNVDHKVAVYFFGGPDDREALAYGCRMAEHPGIQLRPGAQVALDQGLERKMDEAALDLVRNASNADAAKITVEEAHVGEPLEAVLDAARTRNHDIILVGRSTRPTEFVAAHLAQRHPEYSELGPFGDALMAADIRASVLVFQQHDASLHASSSSSSSSPSASV
jgi:nucleotide-binding universal stress UspA family protein